MKQQPALNWNGYFRGVSAELAEQTMKYVTYCSRSWKEENCIQQTRSLLSALSGFFCSVHVTCVLEITSKIWFTHLETQLSKGIKPSSLNTTLRIIQSFLRYLKSNNIAICETMLEVRPSRVGESLPRDLSMSQVKTLLQAVSNPMDRAWILLMLHSGIRTCEIRALRWKDIDLKARTIRINESKGLRSRSVFLSSGSIQALNHLPKKSEQVFIYRNQPLSRRYCQSRLATISKRCGFHIHPHQLRHTCATMLLNAGMSILGVQKILGHKYLETTLKYATVYDKTVVRDFQTVHNRKIVPRGRL